MEVWRTIPGWEGSYEASNYGRIRSLTRKDALGRTIQGKIRKLVPNEIGYLTVHLHRDSILYSRKVHALVCAAFHGARPEGDIVTRHLDGNHLNNTPENLAWGTRSENSADTVRHGRSASANTHCKRGHEYSVENTIRTKRGNRVCRTCYNMKAREGYARRKAATNG